MMSRDVYALQIGVFTTARGSSGKLTGRGPLANVPFPNREFTHQSVVHVGRPVAFLIIVTAPARTLACIRALRYTILTCTGKYSLLRPATSFPAEMSLPRTIERTYEREESTRGRRDTSKASQVAQPTLRTPTIQILPPPAIYDAAVKMGAEKAQMPWWVPCHFLRLSPGIFSTYDHIQKAVIWSRF